MLKSRMILGVLVIFLALAEPSYAAEEPLVPYYAADIYNETAKRYQLVLRTRGRQKIEVVRLTVEPFAGQPLHIHRVRLQCTTLLEVSINNGKTFRSLQGGTLCEGHDTGNRPMLVFTKSEGVMILPVSVD